MPDDERMCRFPLHTAATRLKSANDGESPALGTPDRRWRGGGRRGLCPSASQCTAVFMDGHEYTFDPATQKRLGPVTAIDTSATGISCPTAALCVVGDSAGNVVSFDPSDPSARQTTSLDPGVDFGLVSVSCPSAAQCTAISQTQEVTVRATRAGGGDPGSDRREGPVRGRFRARP